MAQRLGYDFSRVRIHSDHAAASAARGLGAAAFTLGADIFFNFGEFEPTRPTGRGLLAHELTHVVQQHSANTSGPVIQRALIPYKPHITWDDFKATAAGTSLRGEGADIKTPFDLATYEPKTDESRDLGTKCGPKAKQLTNFEATYRAKPEDLDRKPAAQMDQEKSWAEKRFRIPDEAVKFCHDKTSSDPPQFDKCMSDLKIESARLLKHEQGHFDIAETVAILARQYSRMIAEPATATGCGLSAAQDAAEKKYEPIQTKLLKMQSDWREFKENFEGRYDHETNYSTDFGKQQAWDQNIQRDLMQAQALEKQSQSPASTTPPKLDAPHPAPKKSTP